MHLLPSTPTLNEITIPSASSFLRSSRTSCIPELKVVMPEHVSVRSSRNTLHPFSRSAGARIFQTSVNLSAILPIIVGAVLVPLMIIFGLLALPLLLPILLVFFVFLFLPFLLIKHLVF